MMDVTAALSRWRGVELHAPADRVLAMLAPRPLSVTVSLQKKEGENA